MTFAKDFMPLEVATSEFAMKWMALSEAHVTEGIRDPIKVYEYMNFFYVIEGNKRVSVLKYFDASAIRARVHRMIPKYDKSDRDIRLYYRFLDFHKKTKLNQIWLSNEEDYHVLDKAFETYDPVLKFYDDKYQKFYQDIYVPFRRIYKSMGGDSLKITTADAFILYVKIYDLPESFDHSTVEELMPKLISELMSSNVDESRDIKTSADELDKTRLFESISGLIGGKKMKIAFIYAKTINESGWSYSHELGRVAVQDKFKDNIITKSFENITGDDKIKRLIDDLVAEGYEAIFTTALTHRKATLSAALLYDRVSFFNCSGNRPYVHMSSYYGRSYETRFLTGLIAGALTQTHILGYTAAMPTPDTISCINAFTLGARMTNPNVMVKVAYTGVWNSIKDNEDKIKFLIESGADLVSSKNNTLSRVATKEVGITSMLCTINQETKELENYLASPIWKWEVFYTKIINSMLNGSYNRIVKSNKSRQLVNFWWGIESGGIDVYMDYNLVPVETVKLVKLFRNMIKSGQFHPFSGPIKDIGGEVRVLPDQILGEDNILEMDWYVEHVDIMET